MSAPWTAEWSVALARRRLLVLNVLVPLALVAPIALAGAPAAHAAAAYTVLMVFFGVFGSAIPLVRDGASGLLERWILAGVTYRSALGARILAQASLDVLEAAPAALLVLTLGRAAAAPPLVAALALALLVGNALGAWVAAFARSLAEAALFASVASLLLLHGAGVFRTPAPGSIGSAVEAITPFRPLHEAFLEAAGGAPASPLAWWPAAAVGVLFAVLTGWLAKPIVARLCAVRDV